jgi:IclR family transcriptional regulator, pca regulon regulatory protein
MGRVLLAGLTPDRLAEYFLKAKLEKLTEKTVTDRAELEKLIANARRDGYSVVEEELALGVVALAVPVHDASGRVVAALNSSSHSRHASGASLVEQRLPTLQRISRAISEELASVPVLSLSAQV